MEYKQAITLFDNNGAKGTQPQQKWMPPPPKMIKINVDRVTNQSQDCQGLGFVARDEKGSVLVAGSRTEWKDHNPENVEARAMFWAAQTAKYHGWRHVMFEGDAKLVVEALNSGQRHK